MHDWLAFSRRWIKMGLLGFGGPVVQISFMMDECVNRSRTVSEESFAEGLALATVLPGPEAQQLATFLGFREKGYWGGIISGACFVLPGWIIITLIAYFMHDYGVLGEGVLSPIKIAAASLIFYSVFKLSRKQIKLKRSWFLFFFASLLLKIGVSIVMLFAFSLLGIFFFLLASSSHKNKRSIFEWSIATVQKRSVVIPSIAGAALIALLSNPWERIAIISLKATSLSLGGAYSALPILSEAVLHEFSRPDLFYSGIALAELLPGPLMLITSWYGALVGLASPAAHPLILAFFGSLIAAIFTFLPGMVLILEMSKDLRRLDWFIGTVRTYFLPIALSGMLLMGLNLTGYLSDTLSLLPTLLGLSTCLLALSLGLTPAKLVLFAVLVGCFIGIW